MNEFPMFMRSTANQIAADSQATPGVEGYVFDGAYGSQMAFWTCDQTASSTAHVHDFDDDFDEYMMVVEGCYMLIIDGKKIPVWAGEEYFIARGTRHGGEVLGVHGPFRRLVGDGPSGERLRNWRNEKEIYGDD